MKKVLALLLCAVIIFTCCSCSASDLLGGFENQVENIKNYIEVGKSIGKLITGKLDSNKILNIKPTAVKENGINTLCYENLSESQKSIYKYLLTAVYDMPEGWFFCGDKTDSYKTDLTVSYDAVLDDNPQIFWMPKIFAFSSDNGKICVAFKIDENDIKNDYLISKSARDKLSPNLDEKVDALVGSALTLNSEFEKELFVHDYLCKTAEYNLDGGDMIYSSYGALVEGVCVCEGYSRTMQLIMQKLGIKCGLIYGKYEGEGHMWNKISINGNWYNLDVTWDRDQTFGAIHSYFNLTDEEIKKNHTFSQNLAPDKTVTFKDYYNIINYPCTSIDYNYYVFYNLILNDNIYANADKIYAACQTAKSSMEFKSEITGSIDKVLNDTANLLYYKIQLKEYNLMGNTLIISF